MSQFSEMLKEAFVDEPFVQDPSTDGLRASVRKFEQRMRTVRWMSFLAVTFFTGFAVWMALLLFTAPDDTSVRWLLVYAMGLLYAVIGIGFGKGWFALMHNHIAVMKEFKRVELMLLERGQG
jgi:hypothetical protein